VSQWARPTKRSPGGSMQLLPIRINVFFMKPAGENKSSSYQTSLSAPTVIQLFEFPGFSTSRQQFPCSKSSYWRRRASSSAVLRGSNPGDWIKSNCQFVSCGQPFGPTVHHLAAPFLVDNCGQWRCYSRIALIGDRFRGHAPWAA